MDTARINLGKIGIATDAYAVQGNAVLGIRGSGKSYTATYIAERLLDAGVPIVAFDPIGIWRFLRVPARGAGYKVVVAGGEHGDIQLPAHGAAEIMRAAMKDGVSIIFDLYDISLAKADWRRVVESVVKVLLYENKAHGPRHIFLEEAAEFCPQRVQPDQGSVYSAIERLARMGGNAQLGYTLINQRAEEVNKAVLELCDLLILHRQKGRNSLTALSKWLDVAMVKGKIAAEVPALANGEAFVWPAGDSEPVKTKVPAKRTFHPDRAAIQKGVAVPAKTADVSAFVATMRTNLERLVKEAEANDPKLLRAENARLSREVEAALRDGRGFSKAELDAEYTRGRNDGWEARAPSTKELDEMYAQGQKGGELIGRAMVLAKMRDPFNDIAATFAALIVESDAALKARDREPIQREREAYAPSAVARPEYRTAQREKNTEARARLDSIGSPLIEGVTRPQQRILEALALLESFGIAQVQRVQLALWADASPTSSGFANNTGALRTAGLIDYPTLGTLALTELGRSRAPTPAGMTTEQMQESFLAKVGNAKAAILRELIAVYPEDIARDALASKANASATSSGYANNLGALRTLGVIDYSAPGRVVALPVLFLHG